MNPFRRFLDFISYPSHSRTIGFLAFLVVLLAVPLTVNIAQKQQELRQRAAFNEGGGATCSSPADVGKQQQLPCTKSCPDGSTAQGVSVQECQSNLQWFNSGMCYATCPTGGRTTTTDTCTPQGFSCDLDSNTCTNVEGGTIQGGLTCGQSGRVCCRLPGEASACDKKGGQCVDQGYWQQHQSEGKIVNLSCYAGDLVCFQRNASVPDCLATSGQTCDYFDGASCATDKGYNCVTGVGKCANGNGCFLITGSLGSGGAGGGASCPGTGKPTTTPWGGSCSYPSSDKVSVSPGVCYAVSCEAYTNGAKCWYNGKPNQPYNDPTNCPNGTGGACKGFPASVSTDFANICASPLKGTAPCSGKDPICANGTNAIKRQSDASWYCADNAGTTFVANAICPGGSNAGGTQISFTVGLDGIGAAGDSQHPSPSTLPGTTCKPGFTAASCGSNQSPNRKSRTLFYQIFTDSSKTKVLEEGQISVNYNNGTFTGPATLKNTLSNGVTYPVKVRAEGYLARVVNITVNNNSASASLIGANLNLVVGNLIGGTHRQIDSLDYGVFHDCYGKAPTGSCTIADLNDDGNIDIIDFNLFLREFNQKETD